MPKVAVITRHAVVNYGSVLQTYATQTVLERLGYNVEIIDYIRKDEHYSNISKTLISTYFAGANPLKKIAIRLIKTFSYSIAGRKFQKFRKELLNLSNKSYTSLYELTNNPPIADYYCTGSDQVWGSIGGDQYDPAYFLDFVKNRKCIAFSASFGKQNLSDNLKTTFKELLTKYSSISVRENSAVDLLQQLDCAACKVLDPTFLLDLSDWEAVINQRNGKKMSGDYLLTYQLHRNPEMEKYVQDMAKKKNIPLIRITPMLHQIFKTGTPAYLPDLGTFLSLIKNAKYLVTDSFHGTSFALNLGVQFICINPGKTSTRIENILSLTQLENRMLQTYEDFTTIDTVIDYEQVRSILNSEKEKTIQWLKNALEDISNEK